MFVLGIDVETTGLDPANEEITEIAWAIFKDGEPQKPYAARSFLTHTNKEITSFITDLTGIKKDHMEKADVLEDVLQLLLQDIAKFEVKYMIAHNGQFDVNFISHALQTNNLPGLSTVLIDSARDIPYPKSISTRTLRFLAVEHGFMNPFPHSAIFDVFCMMNVVMHYSFQDILDFKSEPIFIITADVNMQTKDLAKKEGFRWQELDGKFFDKKWVKAIKKRDYVEETSKYPFSHYLLEKITPVV